MLAHPGGRLRECGRGERPGWGGALDETGFDAVDKIWLLHKVGCEFEFALECVVTGFVDCGAHGGEGDMQAGGGPLDESVDGGFCPVCGGGVVGIGFLLEVSHDGCHVVECKDSADKSGMAGRLPVNCVLDFRGDGEFVALGRAIFEFFESSIDFFKIV